MADFNFNHQQYWDSTLHELVGTDERDVITGSITTGDSMWASLRGGNDFARIWSGEINFVNGNWGEDILEVSYVDSDTGVVTGYGGIFLGGRDNDLLSVFSGTVASINGNRGNDKVWGLSGAYAMFRGGQDNDQLGVANGLVYGDKGNDAFLMMPPSSNASEYAWVKDYTPGEDSVYYAPSLGSFSHFANSSGLWLYQNNNATMLLEGISSVDQVNLIATDNILTQDVI